MKLSGLLVLGLVSLVEGEVVQSFAITCPTFFIKDQNNKPVTPTVLKGAQYQLICQRYKNKYRYATLYDTQKRIPVYSAYQYNGYSQTERSSSWRIEPQLDGYSGTEMTSESNAKPVGRLGAKQAVNCDYENTDYQKGHVYPHCHNCNKDQADSTFTLSNAAPQTSPDNIQWFHQVEKKVNKSINARCVQNTAHVVTGVIPSHNWINTNVVKDRVDIPRYYWSAFCCKTKKTLISEGYALEMSGDGSAKAEIYGTPGSTKRLGDMNTDLSNEYGVPFKVFGTLPGCS